MKKMPESVAITVERIERVRKVLNLRAADFVRGYFEKANYNFIVSGKRWPSLRLMVGVIEYWGVNPTWLLLGKGDMFLDVKATRGKVAHAKYEVKKEDRLAEMDAKLQRGILGFDPAKDPLNEFDTEENK